MTEANAQTIRDQAFHDLLEQEILSTQPDGWWEKSDGWRSGAAHTLMRLHDAIEALKSKDLAVQININQRRSKMGMPAAPEYKTVGCTFPNTTRVYTYKYDPLKVGRELQIGDQVKVETKDGQKQIVVAELHETPQTEDKFPFKEILSWVDTKHEV